ncbi:conserved hypothetical protein [Lodderomyces elongisporus NRRL YB-4239]|uniref:CFEM domain-containing protein n=1 Tax=Lodderomyces elongisporus (strain ATCC 11503 / CBS 2605 / JCM 1781 / NBRC 1676 / NRRL YB-4239) TaxID=379508 RepID=A5E3W9_LODEL|nr:conserved hypothetical protein [Lodderomyces elongisporus NRRL YB-4239]
MADQYTQYPSVAKTASINGFADRIYDQLPSCAQSCVHENTGSTPCPYWDTGCLCVMPQWSGVVAACIADNCKGDDVVKAESLATSICSSAGVWEPYWFMPASVSSALDAAATEVDTTPSSTADATTTEAAATTEEQPAETTSSSSAAAAETTEGSNNEEAEQQSTTAVPVSESTAVAGGDAETQSSAAPSSAEEQPEENSASTVAASSTDDAEAAEASSASVAVVNGGVANGVAVGGVIAALAALI